MCSARGFKGQYHMDSDLKQPPRTLYWFLVFCTGILPTPTEYNFTVFPARRYFLVRYVKVKMTVVGFITRSTILLGFMRSHIHRLTFLLVEVTDSALPGVQFIDHHFQMFFLSLR